MKEIKINPEQVEALYLKLKREGEASGYYLNPDVQFTKDLVEGLFINEQRYGYQACPCRLATGNKEEDLDIICPCDYRDADLNEFGNCYCGLYVSEEVVKGKKKVQKIPERRKSPWEKELESSIAKDSAREEEIEKRKEAKEKEAKKAEAKNSLDYKIIEKSPLPIWRCRVCGYLCAREQPPLICPICKASKERFEKFIF